MVNLNDNKKAQKRMHLHTVIDQIAADIEGIGMAKSQIVHIPIVDMNDYCNSILIGVET